MLKNNRKKIILFSIIFLVILLGISISYIKLNEVNKEQDTIVFVGNKNIAPIVYKENGTAKGIVVDIAKAIGDKASYNTKIHATDWVQAQNMVLAGEADALLQINPSPEREELYDFSDELLESEFSIFIESGVNHVDSVDNLVNKSVGVEEGGYANHLLKRYDGINIVTIPNIKNGFQRIKSGELDAVVADRWIGEYELAQSRIKGIQVLNQAIEKQYSRIAVKKGNEELLDIINDGLKEIKDDNTMDEILNHWRGKNVLYFTEERIRDIISAVIVGTLIIIIGISLFLINRYKKLSEQLEINVQKRTKELYEANRLLKKANIELEKISIIDELTNVYNRRFFDETIEKIWRIAIRERRSLALIMIDLDNFKTINDTYGHLAGDYCLKTIVNEMKSVINRPVDFIARFGGEEFVITLLNTSEEDATLVAERIRERVENTKVNYEGTEIEVTVSLGVASMVPEENINPADLIYAADEAMYQAKEEGRNRVVAHDSVE